MSTNPMLLLRERAASGPPVSSRIMQFFAGNLSAGGSAITVMRDAETGCKTPLPDSMRRFFVEHDSAEDHGSGTA